jgi:hypothetical protein
MLLDPVPPGGEIAARRLRGPAVESINAPGGRPRVPARAINAPPAPRGAIGGQWTVYFKGGWRGTPEGQLISQIAWLQRGRERIAIAVMTNADPSMLYGEQTIQGVTARLLQLPSAI